MAAKRGRTLRSSGRTQAATNRRELAYAHLKMGIVEGRMRPGEPLAEIELSERIGVSRTPVREALQRLAMEGLVTRVAGRGAFVSALSIPEIVELYQFREALETYVARLAARSPEHASVHAFRDRLEACRSVLTSGETGTYNALIADLDEVVVTLAGNERIGSALREIRTQMLRVRRMAYQNMTRILETLEEHARIVLAIEDGKEDDAAAATAEHIRHSLQHVIQSLARGTVGAA